MSLLQVQDLSVIAHNAGRDVTLVDRVSFELAEGEILEIASPETFYTNPSHPRTQKFLEQIL